MPHLNSPATVSVGQGSCYPKVRYRYPSPNPRRAPFSISNAPLLLDLRRAPFLEYSSPLYIEEPTQSPTLQIACWGLFDHCNIRVSTKILSGAQKPSVDRIHFDKLSLFNGLHRTFISVIDEIVACLVEVEGCDIKQKSQHG